ncbi:MAG: hypothetical protein ACYCSB_09445 [bacterium]
MVTEEKISIHNQIKPPFTWIENDLIRSKKLSYEAMGLYLTFRSFGHGIAWAGISYLCDMGNCGKDKLYRIIDELLAAKLIIRRQIKKENGLFSRVEYRVLSPNDDYLSAVAEFTNQQSTGNTQSQPYREKPDTVKPDTENPPLIRITTKNNNNNFNIIGKNLTTDTAPQCRDLKREGYLATVDAEKEKYKLDRAAEKLIEEMPDDERTRRINKIIEDKNLARFGAEITGNMAEKYLAAEIISEIQENSQENWNNNIEEYKDEDCNKAEIEEAEKISAKKAVNSGNFTAEDWLRSFGVDPDSEEYKENVRRVQEEQKNWDRRKKELGIS